MIFAKKSENAILDELLLFIEQSAVKQEISPIELMKKLNTRAQVKYKQKSQKEESKVPLEAACAIIYNVNLSISQYQKLRLSLKNHSIILPT